MIREDRDPVFWQGVATHPEVWPHISLGHSLDLGAFVQRSTVTPLRAEHGGFLFVRLDALARVYELHTMFTPEGWGREVLLAAKEAFREMFHRGAQLISTFEVSGNWRSRPPKSFGFEPCGDFAPAFDHHLRTWALTQAAWDASPARRRME
jgi:hypothetical protein